MYKLYQTVGQRTMEELRTGITNYIEFYHRKRLHQTLDYKTPAEVYFGQQSAPDEKPLYSLLIHQAKQPMIQEQQTLLMN